MKTETKKIIAGILATGGVVSGGFMLSDKQNCDYEIEYQGEMICLSESEFKAMKEHIEAPSWDNLDTWDKL